MAKILHSQKGESNLLLQREGASVLFLSAIVLYFLAMEAKSSESNKDSENTLRTFQKTYFISSTAHLGSEIF